MFRKNWTRPGMDSDIQVLAPFASYICWSRYTHGQDSLHPSSRQDLVELYQVEPRVLHLHHYAIPRILNSYSVSSWIDTRTSPNSNTTQEPWSRPYSLAELESLQPAISEHVEHLDCSRHFRVEDTTSVAILTFTPSQSIALREGINVRPLATWQRTIYSLVTFFSGHSTCKAMIRVGQERCRAHK